MGGQACIVYGAADFSRDIDVAVAIEPGNLDRLKRALAELEAERIFFPALTADALARGHACHFRCGARGASGMRLDVMGVMRGAGPFAELWRRRVQRRIPGVGIFPLVSRWDLVRIKKTQRAKDWPMVQRLVDAEILNTRRPTRAHVQFWLQECRSPHVLITLVERFRGAARRTRRRAVRTALAGSVDAVRRELDAEQKREQELDRRYWAPLRRELEEMRLGRKRN
jgi:hypothetical protein